MAAFFQRTIGLIPVLNHKINKRRLERYQLESRIFSNGVCFLKRDKLIDSLHCKFAGIEMKVELDEGNVSVEADL